MFYHLPLNLRLLAVEVLHEDDVDQFGSGGGGGGDDEDNEEEEEVVVVEKETLGSYLHAAYDQLISEKKIPTIKH